MKRLLLMVGLMLILCTQGTTQQMFNALSRSSALQSKATTASEKQSHNWRLLISLGGNGKGPQNDFEKGLTANGFNEVEPIYSWGWYTKTIKGYRSTPYSVQSPFDLGFSFTFLLSHRLNSRFWLGALYQATPLGQTHGYKSEPERQMVFDYSAKCFAVFFTFNQMPLLKFATGPALYRFSVQSSSLFYEKTFTKPGILFRASLCVPEGKTFFLYSGLQLNIVGQQTIAPPPFASIALKPFQINFTHWTLNLGLGMNI